MRWAFWRSAPTEPARPLPEDVGLRTPVRPPAAPTPPDPDDRGPGRSTAGTSGATPGPDADRAREVPLTRPAVDVDRPALAASGADLVRAVTAARAGGPVDPVTADPRLVAAAATGALAARLPALSGADGAAAFDEQEDELLHAYAGLLAGRAEHRTGAEREDLLAVAHAAAAAATVDAADDPALLLLAGMPAEAQLRAAALLLAQTADDGGGPPDALRGEVRTLFGASG